MNANLPAFGLCLDAMRWNILHPTLQLAHSKRLIVHVPRIKLLSEAGNARQGFFTRSELERLLPYLPEYLRDFTVFGYLTGWRKPEIASLRWLEDID